MFETIPAYIFIDRTPLNVIYNSQAAVCSFFVLSGFVLAHSSASINRAGRGITRTCLRRYVRLTLPVAASCLLMYVFIKANLIFNDEAAILTNSKNWLGNSLKFSAGFLDMIRFSFFDVYFNYSSAHSYNRVLWTMRIELFGSFMVYAIFLLVKNRACRLIIYGLASLAFLSAPMLVFFLAFVLGMILHEMEKYFGDREKSTALRLLAYFAFLLGIYLLSIKDNGSALFDPVLAAPFFSYYGKLDVALINIVGAFLVIFAICRSTRLTAFFTSRAMRYLGDISFPLYLTHLVVFYSLTSFLWCRLAESSLAFWQSAALLFFVTVVAALGLASLFYRYVESNTLKILKKFT